MGSMAIWIWTAVVGLSLIVEFITTELVSIWFAAAGLVSLIMAALGANYIWQIVIFIVLSAGLLLGVRKFAKAQLTKHTEKTNTDALIGTTHTLITDIGSEQVGVIKLNGVEWNCTTEDGSSIPAGEKVVIVKVQGNKFIVKKESK